MMQRIGIKLVETLVEVSASAEVNTMTDSRGRSRKNQPIRSHVVVRKVRKPKPARKRRYAADPALGNNKRKRLQGGKLRVVAISMPADELALLDKMAATCQMARSHFIRQAVKHFGAKLFPEGDVL